MQPKFDQPKILTNLIPIYRFVSGHAFRCAETASRKISALAAA
jgi:hypothetical protein